MAKIIWPSIGERVKEKQENIKKKFESRNLILTEEKNTSFKIGMKCMYLRREYADKTSVGKWLPCYLGPIIITEMDKRGNYRGVEIDTDLLTRWMPPSHLKVFSEMVLVLDKRPNPYSGESYNFLVEYDDETRLWTEAEYIQKILLKEYSEKKALTRFYKETETQKLRRVKDFEERILRRESELKKEREQLMEMKLNLARK